MNCLKIGACNIRSGKFKLYVRSLSKDEEETLNEIINMSGKAAYKAKK